jgi:hypothetical protein
MPNIATHPVRLFRSSAVRLALGLGSAYLLLGVIAYPWWWWRIVIGNRDTSALWREATGHYFWWNVGAIAIITLAVWALGWSERRAPIIHEIAIEFLNSHRIRYTLGAVAAIAVIRIFLVTQDASREEALSALTRLTYTVENFEPAKQSSKLPKVIDLLYVNTPKIEEFYGQILPRLALKEKSIARTRVDETTGIAGFKDTLSAQSRGENTVSGSETFTEKARTVSEKVVALLNELKSGGALMHIKTLEIDSQKLADFDKSVNLLEKEYKVALPAIQVVAVRRQIVEEIVKSKTSEIFAPNSWVVIEGTFKLTRASPSINVTFDYLPTLPGRITVLSMVPEVALAGLQFPAAQKEITITGFVFGKIDRTDNQNASIVYAVNIYALFR